MYFNSVPLSNMQNAEFKNNWVIFEDSIYANANLTCNYAVTFLGG